MTNEETINYLKSHLAMAVQVFRATCSEAGLDVNGTKLNVSIGDKECAVPIGKMLDKWEEISK